MTNVSHPHRQAHAGPAAAPVVHKAPYGLSTVSLTEITHTPAFLSLWLCARNELAPTELAPAHRDQSGTLHATDYR